MSLPQEVIHNGFRYELLECEFASCRNGWIQYEDGNGEDVMHIQENSGIIEIFQPTKVRISKIGNHNN